MEWLYIEVAVFIAALLFSVWLRRPRSVLEPRVRYVDATASAARHFQRCPPAVGSAKNGAGSASLSHSPHGSQEEYAPTADYVVIGAGPGGLAAARRLLASDPDPGATVYVVEAGHDPAPRSDLAALVQHHTTQRFPLFHTQSVALPQRSLPDGAAAAAAAPPLLVRRTSGPAARDWGWVARRPMLPPAPPPLPSSSSSASSAGRQRIKAVDPLLSFSCYPQGCGLGGTSLMSWGLGVPSMLAAASTPARPWWRVLPLCRRALHPLAWAFAKVLITTGVRNATKELDAKSTAQQHRRQVASTRLSRKKTKKENGASAEEPVIEEEMEEWEEPEWRPWSTSPREGVIWQPLQHSDEDGRRLRLPHALWRGMPSRDLERLHVLQGYQVVRFTVASEAEGKGEGQRVTHVICCPTSQLQQQRRYPHQLKREGDHGSGDVSIPRTGRVVRIHVTKGVVVAAGVVGSPHLLTQLMLSHPTPSLPLRTASSSSSVAKIRDALVLPLLYKAQPGVTVDDVMRRSTSPLFFLRSLFLATPLEALMNFTDVLCSIPLPQECGAHAELVMLLLPFGGRNPALFYQLGIDRILSSYQDAAMVLLVLTGVTGLSHPLHLPSSSSSSSLCSSTHTEQEQEHHKEELEQERELCRRGAYPLCYSAAAASASSTSSDGLGSWAGLSPETVHAVEQAFQIGIERSRACTRLEPLSLLLQGNGEQEALDFTLLHEEPSKAARLARLMHTPPRKMNYKMKREVVDLMNWARGLAAGEAYLKAYVHHHARWLGFGSGSSGEFLIGRPSTPKGSSMPPDHLFVSGYDNVVVGDCSAVSDEWFESTAKLNALLAGNMETAMDMGLLAADQLVERRKGA